MFSKHVFFPIFLGVTVTTGLAISLVYYRRRRTLNDKGAHKIELPSVCIISNETDWAAVLDTFKQQCYLKKYIGLDCEWVTNEKHRQPVALLQLATDEDVCLLIRLHKFKSSIPKSLSEILNDDSILKLGVAIHDDATKLLNDYSIQVKGYMDLRYVVDSIPRLSYLDRNGLKQLAKVVLGVKLEDHWSVRCSDWEADSLSSTQVKYAAEDAVAAALIFQKLISESASRWWHLKPLTSDQLLKYAKKNFWRFANINYQQRSSKSPTRRLLEPPVPKKSSSRSYSTRTRPLYYNCQLHAPDGEPLCTCDVRKAQWYLYKGLGTLISEDPMIVQLNFEPSARPILDNKYYIKQKENICVVCGSSDSFIRKIVVPHEYRKFFPNLMKAHLSHDVLLLCVSCHITSNAHDAVLRQRLAKLCDAPIGSRDDVKCKEDPELKKVKSAGRALLKSIAKLPPKRREELEGIIAEYFQVEHLTEDLIEIAANSEPVFRNGGYIPHGQKVVDYHCSNGGLIAFETMWRQHFLDTMSPSFLPEMWSVDHNHERLMQQIKENPNRDFNPKILGPCPQ